MKLLLIFLLSASTLLAEIPQSGSNAIEYRNERYKIWLKILEEHKKLSKDSTKINNDAQKLMVDFADWMCIKGNFLDQKSLAGKARQLLDSSPKDPVTLLFIGRTLYYVGDNTQRDLLLMQTSLQSAYDAVVISKYSSHVKFLSAKYLRDTIKKSAKLSKKKEKLYETNYTQAFIKYIFEPAQGPLLRYKGQTARDFFHLRKSPQYIKPCFEEIMKKKHLLDSWLREIISGYYHRNLGFLTHQDGKYEDKFNDDHHHSHVTAALHFKEAYNLRPQWPGAAAVLINLSKKINEEESAKSWFLKAIKAEFDYEKAYLNYISHITGDVEALLDFGRLCSATNRYDTIVPYMHVNAVDSVYKSLNYNIEDFKKTKAYEEIHEVLKAYEQNEVKNAYCLTSRKNHMRAIHFCYAFKIGRFSHVRKLHQLFGDSIYSKTFCEKFDLNYKTALSFSYAMSGPAAKLAEVLHKNLSWNQWAPNNKWRTKKELEQLLKTLKDAKAISKERESEFFFEKMTVVANWEKEYLQGKWVNLEFTENLSGWNIFKGNWKVLDKKTIQANTLGDQRQYISSQGMFKPPYIVEVEVESIKSNWKGNLLQAGLIVGQMYGPRTGRSFWVDGFNKRVGFVIPGKVPEGIETGVKTKLNKISVYCWDDRYEIYVNDGEEEYVKNDPGFKPFRVGLGIMPLLLISGKVNYSNFRIKKLSYDKPPKSTDNKALLKYYKFRYEKDPTSYVCTELAKCYANNNEFEIAIETLNQGFKKWPNWRFPYDIGKYSHYSGKFEQVAKMYDLALKMGTYDPWIKSKVLNSYAWFLSTCIDSNFHNSKKAIGMSQSVLKIRASKSKRSYQLGVLSTAYAADGQFDKAVQTANKALKMAVNENLKQDLLIRIEHYKNKKVYVSE